MCAAGPVSDAERSSPKSAGSGTRLALRLRGLDRRARSRVQRRGQSVGHRGPGRLRRAHLRADRTRHARERAAHGREVFAFQVRGRGCRRPRAAAAGQQRERRRGAPATWHEAVRPCARVQAACCGGEPAWASRSRAGRSRTPAARSAGSSTRSLWHRRRAMPGSPARAGRRPSSPARPGPSRR